MENDFYTRKKFIVEDKTIFYSGLIYFIVMVLFVGMKLCNYYGLFNGMNADLANAIYSLIIQVGLMFFLPILLFKLINKTTFSQTFKHFSFKKVSFKTVFLSLVLGVLVFILVNYISSFWYTLISFLGFSSGNSGGTADYSFVAFLFAVLTTGIMPGFCEEVAHRGLMLGSIKNNGIKRAILLSALLFALMHFNVVQFGYAFVVGLILGFVTAITRSIFPAMIIHFTNNTLSVLIEFSLANNWWGSSVIRGINNFLVSGNWFLTTLTSIIVLCLVFAGIMFIFVKLFANSKQEKFNDFVRGFKKQIKGTPLEQDIEATSKQQLFNLYTQMTVEDLQKKIEKGNVPFNTMQTLSQKPSPFDIMLIERDLERKGKTHKADYLFIYLAIILGSLGTFFSFLWGIM